jgi:hypothetical protein
MALLPKYTISFIVSTQHYGGLAVGIVVKFRVYVPTIYHIRTIYQLNHISHFLLVQ